MSRIKPIAHATLSVWTKDVATTPKAKRGRGWPNKTPSSPSTSPLLTAPAPPKKTESVRCTCRDCSPDYYKDDRHNNPTAKFATFRTRFAGANCNGRYVEEDFKFYEYLSLSQACAQSFVESAKLTKRQDEALNTWNALKDKQAAKNIVSILALRTVLSIFDELFFAGSLQCVVVVTKSRILDGDTQLYGITSYPKNWHPSAQILIDPKYCWTGKDSTHKSDNIFLTTCGCLLHEMCHAFLGLYGCDRLAPSSSDDKDEERPKPWCVDGDDTPCTRYRNDNLGAHGHGRAWHTLAKAIEDSSAALLGTKIKLFNSRDAILEISAPLESGDTEADRWLPSKCDLEKLFSSEDAKIIRKEMTKRKQVQKTAASGKAATASKKAIKRGRARKAKSTKGRSSPLGLQTAHSTVLVEKKAA
jgi:hypothetical protein